MSFVNERYVNAQGSPLRELIRFSEEPGMISLGGGRPDSELLDAAGLQSAFGRVPAKVFANSLDYGGTDGALSFRMELARLCELRGIKTKAVDILVLSGSQQGIDLLARTLISKGDTVLMEAPTYPTAIASFRFAGANIRQVATDAEGLIPEDLERALAQFKPKVLYTVPTFGNPGGHTMSEQRRREVLTLAVRHQCLIIEDDPYAELWFHEAPPPSIYALRHVVHGGEDVSIYLSSLSKTLAPGLRLGWMLAPPAVRRAAVLAKQTDDLQASTVNQAAATTYIAEGLYAANVPRMRAIYARRAEAMVEALRSNFGDRLAFAPPGGGMFLWGRLDGIDTNSLFKAGIARKVVFAPGGVFYPEQQDPSTLRLSFSSQSEDGIREGVQRLAQAFHSI